MSEQSDRSEISLDVRNLSKRFDSAGKKSFLAVNDISFSIRSGECLGLLGPNGAGKSTTIHCVSGFYPATSGQVLIQGHDVHTDPKLARSFLGICFQEDNLDTDFNVRDQLVRHATFFRIPVSEGKRRADELLVKFNLSDKATEPVESLSGGMRRRLQVARALMSNPRLLVLDEPTTGLDPEVRRSLWEIIQECKSAGMGILLSTHYLDEAERLCDRVAILHRGKIKDIQSPETLISKYITKKEIEEEIRTGVFWKRPANLEDVYLKLTGTRLNSEIV